MSRHEKHYNDSDNWVLGHFYVCRQDPRLLVPKWRRPGWTFNWAHPAALPLTGLLAAFLAGAGWVIATR